MGQGVVALSELASPAPHLPFERKILLDNRDRRSLVRQLTLHPSDQHLDGLVTSRELRPELLDGRCLPAQLCQRGGLTRQAMLLRGLGHCASAPARRPPLRIL